jgi:carboxylesterase type B
MIITPELYHPALNTTFVGVEHPISTHDSHIHSFRGIKYASVPARFRQSKLFTSYRPVTDASRDGSVVSMLYRIYLRAYSVFIRPICPQQKYKTLEEEMFGLSPDETPTQYFKQNEFECLNLNITCPAGMNNQSRLPVMLWIHGFVVPLELVLTLSC